MEKDSSKLMELYEIIREKAKQTCTDVFEYIKQLQSSMDDVGGFKGFVKWASNMEEKKCDTFSFAQALEWIKPKLNQAVHGGAIIFKKEVDPNVYEGKKLMIKISFADKSGSPLDDTESKYLIVLCDSVDDDLKNYFGTKDMIVLK